MADLFVSYKREDSARVGKLVAALRSRGLDVWWDEDIPPSAPWEATIEKALADAKAVIVCWSPDAVASEYVRSEARVAREDGRLLQVFMKPCSPPLFFGERQGVDLSGWRGKADDPRIARVVESARALAAGQKPHVAPARLVRRWFNTPVHAAIAALVVLAGSLAGWWLLSPAKAEGPQALAVLPFRALNSADANLVDAIWDDTRGAISKNPNLRVLGRLAVEALAKQDLTPAEYRKRVGADYLLDGSIEHVGDQVRMKLNLTRTRDAAEVWSDEIGGKLDDVLAFQQRVAREVEGRIRGRVAPGGGAVAKNIATSGEVYSIFAEARAFVRQRNPEAWQQARRLLQKAVALDPNYAPAWAELGVANYFASTGSLTPQEQSAEPIRDLSRALQLAPNLAHAHAALAMVRHVPPESEPDLRRAVTLDPSDAEAWLWFGSLLETQYRLHEASEAFDRAIQIEPFLPSACTNKISVLARLNDQRAIDNELKRVAATGDPVLLARVRYALESTRGHPGSALAVLIRLRLDHPAQAKLVDNRASAVLQQLGYVDEAQKLYHNTPAVAGDYKGVPEPSSAIWSGWKDPTEFWLNSDSAATFGRLLPRHGRLKEYIDHYVAAFPTADRFIEARSFVPETLVQVAPTVAAVLRAGGQGEQAEQILGQSEGMLAAWLKNAPNQPDLLAELAYFRAARGADSEAVSLLARGVQGGWLPDNQYYASDIAEEPAFSRLLNRSDFQVVRRTILARLAEERTKVSSAQLLAAGYTGFRSRLAA